MIAGGVYMILILGDGGIANITDQDIDTRIECLIILYVLLTTKIIIIEED